MDLKKEWDRVNKEILVYTVLMNDIGRNNLLRVCMCIV